MEETLNYCIPRMQAYAELLYSMNAVTQQGPYNPHFLHQQGVSLSDKLHLSHKDPCPERGLNHSKVVIRKQ